MFGFDIGSHEMKIATVEGGKVKALVSVPMPEGLVQDGQITSFEDVAELIKTALKDNKLRGGKQASVILPSGITFLRRIKMPPMNVSQLNVNLPYEFKDYLTMEKNKYYFDYRVNAIKEDQDGNPSEMDLTAAAVAKTAIEDYREMFRRAGLKLTTAIPAECAYANVISALNGDSGKEYCFLDLGHTATRLLIYTGTVYETSKNMESALAAKNKAAAENDSENIYSSIALEARKALNFYSFSYRDSNLSDAYLAGGGMNNSDLTEALRGSLDVTLHPADDILPESAKQVKSSGAGAWVLAIGAALQEKEGK